MDYKKYFERLIAKSAEASHRFPNEYQFTHRENNYYADPLSYRSVKFNYVVASSRSQAFGSDFEGLIVEIYIEKNVDSYYSQLKAQAEEIELALALKDKIIWKSKKESQSQNVARMFARKHVDIDDESKWDEYIEWQVNTMARFLEVLPKYIDQLTDKRELSMEEEEFRNKYKKFVNTLPLHNSGTYAKLYTKSQNKPFKVNKNSSGSIVVRAFTDQSSPMVITANQLSKVLFNDDRYLYSSYEPVLIERINEEIVVNESEIVEEEVIESTRDLNIKNIILYGVPGVGKTHNTKKLISLVGSGKGEKEIFDTIKRNDFAQTDISAIESRISFITFHQNFGYEDFIEGFRPNENGHIELVDGVFKRLCEKAGDDKTKNYYLVIDEINRGNISKIFGELITLIEEDKRDTYEVTLPYSKEKFSVPSNLYIIGTMNSTDKSIALIDVALRRRFTFLKMEPNSELIKHAKAKEIFNVLNGKLKEKLGSEHLVGHSYFMTIETDDDLEFVLEYKIKPLLEEYFYGDENALGEILDTI